MLLTDQQLQILSRNPEFKTHGKTCPVCLDRGVYTFRGEEFVCPDDDYGHVMLRKAKTYWVANIGLQYQQLNWEDYPHADARQEIDNYVDKYDFCRLQGIGITLRGATTGVGKTWGATHVLKELVGRGVDGWFVPFWEIMGYKDLESEERLFKTKRMQEAELLVLDDITEPYTQRMKDYQGDKLEELVRPRTDRNLPTIITTNMDQEEMEATFPRVFSLLMAKNLDLELSGFDARMNGVVWEENARLALNGEARPIF